MIDSFLLPLRTRQYICFQRRKSTSKRRFLSDLVKGTLKTRGRLERIVKMCMFLVQHGRHSSSVKDRKKQKRRHKFRDRRRFVSLFLAVASRVEITVGRSSSERYPRNRAMRFRITSRIRCEERRKNVVPELGTIFSSTRRGQIQIFLK